MKIPFTTKIGGVDTDVVVTVRGMSVARDDAGAAVVTLDDYDVHYATGAPVAVEVLDAEPGLSLAAEEAIEDCILSVRPAPTATARPQPQPADGHVAEAAA